MAQTTKVYLQIVFTFITTLKLLRGHGPAYKTVWIKLFINVNISMTRAVARIRIVLAAAAICLCRINGDITLDAGSPIVVTPGGRIRGLISLSRNDKSYYSFLGIRYGQTSGRFMVSSITSTMEFVHAMLQLWYIDSWRKNPSPGRMYLMPSVSVQRVPKLTPWVEIWYPRKRTAFS